ncbi:MAG: ParB/RepB/Spo0J family partition protein [Clostridiales bacterium]
MNETAAKEILSKTQNLENQPHHSNRETTNPTSVLLSYHGKKTLDWVKSKSLILPPNNPYFGYNPDTYKELLESIKISGVHEPIIVRDLGDGSPYQILSGNHRNTANIEAGNDVIEAIILGNICDAYANNILSKANIIRSQKGDFIPSELAKIYKMSLEAEKILRQKKMQNGEILHNKVGQSLAQDHGISDRTFYRYVHLADLIPQLLDMVDSGDMEISTGAILSRLEENCQMEAYVSSLELHRKLTLHIAEILYDAHKAGKLTTLNIKDYITGMAKSPTAKKPKDETIKIDRDLYYQTFPNWKKKAINHDVAQSVILLHKTVPETLIQAGVECNPNTKELIQAMLKAYIIQQKENS